MDGDEGVERVCDLCGRPWAPPGWSVPDEELTLRQPWSGAERQVRLPATLALCAQCKADNRAVGCCPRCRMWGRLRPWSPYGSPCSECGCELVQIKLR